MQIEDMKGGLPRLAAMALSLLLVAAVSGGRSDEAWSAPAVSGAADGDKLYRANCVACHARDGKGTAKMRAKGQPDFTDATWQQSRTDDQFFASIKNGKGKFMPAWKNKLSDEEVAALVKRVRVFAKKD